jgi:hypothetical protein
VSQIAGSEAPRLTYRFTVDGDRITDVVIAG